MEGGAGEWVYKVTVRPLFSIFFFFNHAFSETTLRGTLLLTILSMRMTRGGNHFAQMGVQIIGPFLTLFPYNRGSYTFVGPHRIVHPYIFAFSYFFLFLPTVFRDDDGGTPSYLFRMTLLVIG